MGVGEKGKGLEKYEPPRTQAPPPLPPPSKCLAHALGGCTELCRREEGEKEDCVAELLRWVEDMEEECGGSEEDCTICSAHSRTTHASAASVEER